MLRRSFLGQVYGSYAALVLVCTGAIGWFVLGRLKEQTLRETETALFRAARLLAAMEAANPLHLWSEQLPRQIREVAADTGLHLSLVFANGRVAAESAPTLPPEAVAVRALEEFASARTASQGRARRRLEPGGVEHLLVAVPILLESELIGYARVGLALDRLGAQEASLRSRVLAGASVSAIVALALGYFFARYTSRPLAAIAAVADRLARGDLAARVGLRRSDEVGLVARTLDHMAGELQRRVARESRERERLATLLASMNDGVVAVDAGRSVVYLNAVAARLLALDASGAIGRPLDAVVTWAELIQLVGAVRAAGSPTVREMRIRGHPQDLVLQVEATPLPDAEDGPSGLLLVLHDLTELRRLEELRRTFAANVSHELKTPLTAIGSIVDALLDDPEMQPSIRARFLERIRFQAERLDRLVRELLMISRLESERSALDLTRVAVAPIVGQCVETFAEVARRKGLALRWEPPAEAVVIAGHEEALRLILNNLLHNAVTYTPEGGSVGVVLTAADGWASLAVRDTGIGIAPEHRERIFERFYRVDRARSRDQGGSGLGLSIVKHLCQALGGAVRVESEPQRGSVFIVQLPLAGVDR